MVDGGWWFLGGRGWVGKRLIGIVTVAEGDAQPCVVGIVLGGKRNFTTALRSHGSVTM
jgi:hypothetical protein